jgi:hypothetical protein
MRDIKRAEQLLSLFTSSDSAAGIVGDLSEERGQRGSAWFWRQVLGTTFSLCRGVWLASPVALLLLVLLGFALDVGLAVAQRYLWDFIAAISILQLITYLLLLFIGAVLVAVAPRLGMAACVLLAIVRDLFSLSSMLYVISTFAHPVDWWAWRFVILGFFLAPLSLCLGGAIVRHLWTERQLRKVA